MSEADLNRESQNESGPQTEAPAVRPGAQLAAYRQTRGWSIEQVANQLNLAPRQIQALESDNYAALPGMVIARGFVRTYAKLLKIDPAPLIAMMADEATAAPGESLELGRALSAAFSESSLPSGQRRSVTAKFLLTVLAFSLLLGGGWLAHQFGLLQAVPAWLAAKDRQPSLVADMPMADAEQGNATAELSPDPVAEAALPIAMPPATVNDNPTLNMTDTIRASANPKDGLVLRFREESWIEIRRADKVAVVSRLVMAGATESFEIKQPVLLTVGNASGVDASLRGKPLDLVGDAKTNVARVELK